MLCLDQSSSSDLFECLLGNRYCVAELQHIKRTKYSNDANHVYFSLFPSEFIFKPCSLFHQQITREHMLYHSSDGSKQFLALERTAFDSAQYRVFYLLSRKTLYPRKIIQLFLLFFHFNFYELRSSSIDSLYSSIFFANEAHS